MERKEERKQGEKFTWQFFLLLQFFDGRSVQHLVAAALVARPALGVQFAFSDLNIATFQHGIAFRAFDAQNYCQMVQAVDLAIVRRHLLVLSKGVQFILRSARTIVTFSMEFFAFKLIVSV